MQWKKGRGKLGPLSPLLGSWVANADSPMGKVKCTRTFTEVLGANYIELVCTWKLAKGTYEERALFGVKDGVLTCWSFTNDGKNSMGVLTAATDIHPNAVCFESQMPAGLARQVYWPDEEDGFQWAVESRNKKGWKRFVVHHYAAL